MSREKKNDLHGTHVELNYVSVTCSHVYKKKQQQQQQNYNVYSHSIRPLKQDCVLLDGCKQDILYGLSTR